MFFNLFLILSIPFILSKIAERLRIFLKGVAKKIEVTCAYDSCDFGNDTKAITVKLLDLKPFYLKPALLALPRKYPFIKISRDAEDTRLVTCHLNEIPSLRANKVLNSPFLKYLTIKYLKCEEDKVTIKLGLAGTLEDIINDARVIMSRFSRKNREIAKF